MSVGVSASLSELRNHHPLVLPSLLSSDFGNLEREIARLEEAGAKALHLDVMDGNFVPNLTFGMMVVEAIRRRTRLPLDVHLMIMHPERYVRRFREAGADVITFHVEAVDDPRPLLTEIRRLGAWAGITLNPGTDVSAVQGCLDLCDLVLVMSVDAGFGGQEFNPVALDKLRSLRKISPPCTVLEVDGGVNEATIGQCAEAGAQWFVAGSAVFSQPDYGAVLQRLTELARLN